jgi:two-component system cell cycle response regulator
MKKILIIDDDRYSRQLLVEMLTDQYQAFEATDLDEALELSQAHNPTMILVDMERDDKQGPKICAALKDTQQTAYTPIMLLSSGKQKDQIVQGLHAGADDYLTKPINSNELLARIDCHLRTRDFYADLSKQHLLTVLELSEIISVTRNPKRILRIIVEKVAQALGVSRCSIIAINDHGELVVKASNDLSSGEEVTITLDNYPEIDKALTTQRPVVLQDLVNDPLMAAVKDKIKGLKTQAVYVLPLIKKQNVIGTFFLRTAVSEKQGITEDIFKLCQVIANISGNALENAVLFEAMQSTKKFLEDVAIRDGLTKLYNYQYLHTRMEEEFARAKRYQQPLSCLFIDLDDFKSINDLFGHITGDVVLKQTGNLIQTMLRKSDLAARYGGEEFVILLPNTDASGAKDFSDRVLHRIRALSIESIKGAQVTASIGIATFHGDDIQNYEELLRDADNAMYEAKSLGKSRVCFKNQQSA